MFKDEEELEESSTRKRKSLLLAWIFLRPRIGKQYAPPNRRGISTKPLDVTSLNIGDFNCLILFLQEKVGLNGVTRQ
jgi:hypothetical protein